MLYPIKANMALAAMNVPPTQFNGKWRSGMQQIGKKGKLTPHETALVIVAYGLGINYTMDVETAIGVWRHEQKIDLSKPAVINALQILGYNI
jgi:hypothetical protein